MKKAILLAAFGASNPLGKSGLQIFEAHCRQNFPFYPVRWAYTSTVLRERLIKQKQKSDSVRKALLRLYFEKFSAVAIQPLQTIPGREHSDICYIVNEIAKETGLICKIGLPLLNHPDDTEKVAKALILNLPNERKPDECVIFMGHGANHPAVSLYADLSGAINKLDNNIFIGAMNGACSLDNILPNIKSQVVWLIPLLSTIGQHALRDMAGNDANSWRSRIESAGHLCKPVLRGTAEYIQIADIWINNLQKAFNCL